MYVTCASSQVHVQPSVVCMGGSSRAALVSEALGPLARTRRCCLPGLIPHDGAGTVGLPERHPFAIQHTENTFVAVETLPPTACPHSFAHAVTSDNIFMTMHDELFCRGGFIVVVRHQ